MANGYTIDPALPNPDATLPGDPITADEMVRLFGALNCASAWVGSGPVFQQSWPHGRCSHEGATPQVEGVDVPIARWRIDLPTTHHKMLVFFVRAEKTGMGNAAVTVRSAGNDNEVTLNLDVDAGDTWDGPYSLDLDTAGGAPITGGAVVADDIEMYIASDAGTTATVWQIAAELTPIAAPMPAAAVVGYTGASTPPLPTGTTTAAGRPLDAARARAVDAAIAGIYRRLTPLCALSHLSTEYPAVDASDASDRAYDPAGVVAYPDYDDRRLRVLWSLDPEGAWTVGINIDTRGAIFGIAGTGVLRGLLRALTSSHLRERGGSIAVLAKDTVEHPPILDGEIQVGTPTQGVTMRLWAAHAALLTTAVVRRSVALHVGLDESVTPHPQQSPLDVDEEHRVLWRAGPRVGAVFVAVLLSSAPETDGNPAAWTAALYTLTGELVDAGYEVTVATYEGDDVTPWVARYASSGSRIDRAAGEDVTRLRALNAWGQSGEWLELRISTTNARLVEAHAVELAEHPISLEVEE